MESKKERSISGVEPNLSSTERVFSLISGSILLTEAIRKRSTWRGIAAGYALARGITGFCPVENIFESKKDAGEEDEQ